MIGHEAVRSKCKLPGITGVQKLLQDGLDNLRPNEPRLFLIAADCQEKRSIPEVLGVPKARRAWQMLESMSNIRADCRRG
jgi:hypothetical protein